MKGTVIRRGNKWAVIIDMGRDPVTGKRVRKWHSGFDRKRDAEAARVEILSRISKGTYVQPTRQTFGEFLLDSWLPAQRSRLAPTTFSNYTTQVEAYILPHLGARQLQEITPTELNVFYAGLLEAGGHQGRELSAKSVRNVHGVVRRAFGDAVRWDLIARNPAAVADPPKPPRRPRPTWTEAQVRTFIETVDGDRLAEAWVLAASTGMRRAEVLGLAWSSVDLEASRLSVSQTLVEVDSKPTLRSDAKTASGRRSIALDPFTVARLRDHRKRQLEERLAAGAAWQDTGLVFTREDGSPVIPSWFTRAFQRHARKAGLPEIRLHDLRHTWATLALSSGKIHPKVVQERIGHSTISMTLDTYSHVVPAMESDAAEIVAAMIFAG